MSSSGPRGNGEQPLESTASHGKVLLSNSQNSRSTQDNDKEFNTQLLNLVSGLTGAQEAVYKTFKAVKESAKFLELKYNLISSIGQEAATLLADGYMVSPKFNHHDVVDAWATTMARRVQSLDVPQQQKESFAKLCFHRECLGYTYEKKLRDIPRQSEASIQESVQRFTEELATQWKENIVKRFAKDFSEVFEKEMAEEAAAGLGNRAG